MQIYNFYSTPPNFLPSFCYLDFTFLIVYVHIGNFYSFLAIFCAILCTFRKQRMKTQKTQTKIPKKDEEIENAPCPGKISCLPRKKFAPAQEKIKVVLEMKK